MTTQPEALQRALECLVTLHQPSPRNIMQNIKTMISMTGKVLGQAFENTGVNDTYSFHHFGDDVTVDGFDSLESAWDALWVYHEDEYQYGNA